jgi:hypothetical protein
MRGVLLAVALGLAVGCAKKDEPTSGGGNAPVKDAETPVALPAATSKLRVDSYDAYSPYAYGGEGAKHQDEGKRIVFRVSGGEYGVRAGGKSLVLEGSSNLFKRPRAVYVLSSDAGFKKGDAARQPFIEGILRGAVEFSSKDWAKDWLKLTQDDAMKSRFVLIEDARFVSEPKN